MAGLRRHLTAFSAAAENAALPLIAGKADVGNR